MPPNPEDIPVTSASLRVRGDAYGSLADSGQFRLIDSSASDSLFGTSSNQQLSYVDPITGADKVGLTGGPLGDAINDRLTFGLYNASFMMTPPDPTQPIDSINKLPFWSVGGTVASSTSAVTWTLVPSDTQGSYLKVSGDNISAGDDVFIEQYIPTRQMYSGAQAYWPTLIHYPLTTPLSVGFTAYINIAYYTPTGTLLPFGPYEASQSITAIGISKLTATDPLLTDAKAPAGAAFARIRVGIRNASAYASAWSWNLFAVHLDSSRFAATFSSPASGYLRGMRIDDPTGAMVLTNEFNVVSHMLGPNVVAIPFSLANVPANVTTNLQMWGDTALALTTPKIAMPWKGSIIGYSYRLSTAITASTLRFKAVSGSGDILLFPQLNTASPVQDSVKASAVSGGGYGLSTFTAGTNLGVDVIAGATFTPTTLDVAVILWIAMDWNGS